MEPKNLQRIARLEIVGKGVYDDNVIEVLTGDFIFVNSLGREVNSFGTAKAGAMHNTEKTCKV